MDLINGFTLNSPNLLLPWGISESDVRQLLESTSFKRVTHGYFTVPVRALGTVDCILGLHLRPADALNELEFFRTSYADPAESFENFQQAFEREFGPPTSSVAGTEGFPRHEWLVPGAVISHFVFDRFGPEEHMRVKRRGHA